MIHEFALDPEVISDWQSFRFFVDQFGVPTGRLISEFPGKWKRMVYDAVKRRGGSEIERKRVEQRLSTIDDRLLKQSRNFDGGLAWVRNAVNQHKIQPFHAIISGDNTPDPKLIVKAEQVDETHASWHVPRQAIIEREPDVLAETAAPLLLMSRRIIFVDPHFKPHRNKFLRPLEHFIVAADLTRTKKFEYHFKVDEQVSARLDEEFKKTCEAKIAPLLPLGTSMRLVRWRKRAGGKSFHARYVLTEFGGIWYDYGLDEGDELGDTTNVALLESHVYTELWLDFQVPADMTKCSYEFDNEFLIEGSKQ